MTFGSGHKYLRPKSIHDPEIVDELAKDYMYIACIKFINSASICAKHGVMAILMLVFRLRRILCDGIRLC